MMMMTENKKKVINIHLFVSSS